MCETPGMVKIDTIVFEIVRGAVELLSPPPLGASGTSNIPNQIGLKHCYVVSTNNAILTMTDEMLFTNTSIFIYYICNLF